MTYILWHPQHIIVHTYCTITSVSREPQLLVDSGTLSCKHLHRHISVTSTTNVSGLIYLFGFIIFHNLSYAQHITVQTNFMVKAVSRQSQMFVDSLQLDLSSNMVKMIGISDVRIRQTPVKEERVKYASSTSYRRNNDIDCGCLQKTIASKCRDGRYLQQLIDLLEAGWSLSFDFLGYSSVRVESNRQLGVSFCFYF